MRGQAERKSGWMVKLKLLLRNQWVRLVIGTLIIALLVLVIAPGSQRFYNLHGETVVLAAEKTVNFFLAPKFGPSSVLLSPELIALAKQEGISENDLAAIIAAAVNEGVRADHLLGMAKIESTYCVDLGGGSAFEQILIWIAGSYGQKNLRALEEIASQLGVEVSSIPGSIGGGAISCFQLLPYNWVKYGGGDYRDTFQAAMNSARYLKDNGYEQGFAQALANYNPNGGQGYIDDVIAVSSVWEGVVDTAILMEPLPINWLTVLVVYSEYLGWLMAGGQVVPIVGEFVHPYPGASLCGNGFGEVISPTYIHWGVDLCLPEGQQGPVYAAHDGQVVFAGLINRHDGKAYDQTADGYVSASGYVVILEGQLADGRWIQTIYAHLDPATLPATGSVLSAGDYLATTRCSFNLDVEYCASHHLHWGVKIQGEPIDGGFGVNPLDLISSE